MRKSMISASPNPPKTLPKCLQNRRPQKDADFRGNGLQKSSIFERRTLENINFPLRKITIFDVFERSTFLLFRSLLASKILPKTLPNRSRNDIKIHSENGLLFDVGFFAFRPHFGGVWGSIFEPKFAILASKSYLVSTLELS